MGLPGHEDTQHQGPLVEVDPQIKFGLQVHRLAHVLGQLGDLPKHSIVPSGNLAL